MDWLPPPLDLDAFLGGVFAAVLGGNNTIVFVGVVAGTIAVRWWLGGLQ